MSAEPIGGVISAVFEEAGKSASEGAKASAGLGKPGESVLWLRNGEIIQGRVERSGDRYQVRVPGGEIFVKAAEVQHECRDLGEVYERKAALIQRDRAMDRLELAQWCIKVGLLEHAASELDEAAALEPKHPMLEILRRRLSVASTPLPQVDPSSRSASAGPTAQELDRMVRGMPPKTVEIFAQTIQPMLVNNCSAAACHGQSVTNGFRLLRVPADSPPSRLLTQRNLHATLQWLDRDSPDASPLLTYATRAHGAARVPVFTDRQMQQFRQLRDWCYRVAKADAAVMQASYEEPAGAWESDAGRGAQGSARAARRPRSSAGHEGSARSSSPPAPDPGTVDLRSGRASGGHHPPGRRDRSGSQPASDDPFDPEVFNRQFSPPPRPKDRPTSATSEPSPAPSDLGRRDDG
ncbi:MAG: hypothetical protein N2439_16325 [Anaerolineae bacterium]|nr:hypothetical protein [Anaerolineae bacterium]